MKSYRGETSAGKELYYKEPLECSMKVKTFSVGIVGLNHGVKLLLPALMRSKQVNSISLAGSNSSIGKKISSQNHDFVIMSVDELIESQNTQVIFICTPPATHLELVEKALYSKKFVYCEKPGGLTSDEIKEVSRLSIEAGMPVVIGYEYRFDPFIIFLKNYLKKINPSSLTLIQVDWETSGALNLVRQIWKREGANGGEVVRDFLPHVIDYLKLCRPSLLKDYKENEITVRMAEVEYDQIQLNFKIRNVEFEISISRKSANPIGHRIRVSGGKMDVEVIRNQPYSLEAGKIFINGALIDIRNSQEISNQISEIESEITFKNSLQTYATHVLVKKFLLSCSDGDFSRAPSIHEALENMQMIDFIINESPSGVRE